MLATKSVSQGHSSEVLLKLLAECRIVTENGIRFAEENGVRSRKGMKKFYRSLKTIELPSSYKVGCISRACAVVESRRASGKRGRVTRHPKPLKLQVCVTSGFFWTVTGKLFIQLGHGRDAMVQLNRYVFSKISDPKVKVRSLTITPFHIAFCYSAEIQANEPKTVWGIDRNEKNLAYGNRDDQRRIDVSKIVQVNQNTREIVASLKRPDVKIQKKIASKYWLRAKHRNEQVLHCAAKRIVADAVEAQAALAYEDLTGIKEMYRKGNGQGRDCRFRMNKWPYRKALGYIQYNAAWNSVMLIPLTRSETRGTSTMCVGCGERLLRPRKGDAAHARMLWCQKCQRWYDRDETAVVNIAERGLSRLKCPWLASSRPLETGEKGPAGEAMKGNGAATFPIPGADAGKLG